MQAKPDARLKALSVNLMVADVDKTLDYYANLGFHVLLQAAHEGVTHLPGRAICSGPARKAGRGITLNETGRARRCGKIDSAECLGCAGADDGQHQTAMNQR